MPDDQTPNLALPYIMAAQAQKHVTHNEAIRMLDALVQLTVVSRAEASPPSAPVNGARYIVPASPGGVWFGHASRIAAFQDAAWAYFTPVEGWTAWVADEDVLVAWNGTAWGGVSGAGSTSLNPASGGRIGVNATADSTNKLAVKSDAVLLSHDDVTPGSGDHRVILNKSAAANTTSFLFQDAFSGRAEVGLTGDDNLHVKVSPDGSAWSEALVIERSTGKVSMPFTPSRELLTAARTYYVRIDGNDANTGLGNTAGAAFRTIQKAINVVLGTLDFGGFNVTIQVGAGTYTENLTASSGKIGAGSLFILGDTATPANCVVAPAAGGCFFAGGGFAGTLRGFRLQPKTNALACDGAGSRLRFGDIEFAGTPSFHIYLYQGGVIEAIGNYKIVSSSANGFVWATDTGTYFASFGRTITFVGTPSLPLFAQIETLAGAQFGGCTFVGSCTGYRFYIFNNAVLHTYGASASYLPGSIAGITGAGGLYA